LSYKTSVQAIPQKKDIYFKIHHSTKRENLPVNSQVHSGSFSVMFWGCFSKLGLGPLVALEGNMKGEKYVEVLKDTLLPELVAAGIPMTFMQDNAHVKAPTGSTREICVFSDCRLCVI
jgi:predicted RNase H-like nuclease